MGVTQELAKQIVNAKFEDIPPKAIERIKRGILDDIGIGFLGYYMNGKSIVEYGKDAGRGLPESTIIGDGAKVSCIFAAGVNSQMATETDFNETGPGGHSLSPIAQTAISLGERVGASGKDIIAATALAYEINARFHRAAFPLEMVTGDMPKRANSIPHSRHFVVNATIAAAKVLGLSEKQINNAIGIAWYFVGESFGTVSDGTFLQRYKRMGVFNLGYTHLGIEAALLAQKGFGSPMDVIEDEPSYDPDRLLASPSPYYHAENELHLKPWISSRGVQPGISAVLDIVKEEDIKVEDIEEIRYKAKSLYFEYPLNNPEPTGYWDGVYSVQWPFAMTLLGIEPGPEWFTEERLNDPVALALAKKVKLEELPEATEIWESGVRYTNLAPTEVDVLVNGKVYTKRRTYGETPGSSMNPMTKEQLGRKFITQSSPVIGGKQAEELFGMLSMLEDCEDIREITKLYGPR